MFKSVTIRDKNKKLILRVTCRKTGVELHAAKYLNDSIENGSIEVDVRDETGKKIYFGIGAKI